MDGAEAIEGSNRKCTSREPSTEQLKSTKKQVEKRDTWWTSLNPTTPTIEESTTRDKKHFSNTRSSK